MADSSSPTQERDILSQHRDNVVAASTSTVAERVLTIGDLLETILLKAQHRGVAHMRQISRDRTRDINARPVDMAFMSSWSHPHLEEENRGVLAHFRKLTYKINAIESLTASISDHSMKRQV